MQRRLLPVKSSSQMRLAITRDWELKRFFLQLFHEYAVFKLRKIIFFAGTAKTEPLRAHDDTRVDANSAGARRASNGGGSAGREGRAGGCTRAWFYYRTKVCPLPPWGHQSAAAAFHTGESVLKNVQSARSCVHRKLIKNRTYWHWQSLVLLQEFKKTHIDCC